MGESQSDGFPSEPERGYYKLYQERIAGEDGLIHQRVSWLLTG